MRLFSKGDLDGFFGLFVDNLVQLILIVALCGGVCGMSGENSRFLYDLVLPGAAVSILFGNVFYALLAHWLAKRQDRDDVTALPYGINTPSLIVYIFFVMKPAFDKTGDVDYAWRMGLLACLGSGIIEFAGSFFAPWIRRWTPRAALLSTLAGIAIGFIAMTFALQIYQKPIIALLPLGIILVALFAKVRFPGGLPGGLVAITLGTGICWLLTLVATYIPTAPSWLTYGAGFPSEVIEAQATVGLKPPVWCWNQILSTWNTLSGGGPKELLGLLTVVVPMGLFNVIGSMQNIESAAVAGDEYPTLPSMAINGLGTIVAALFGSCFPTTIYIGHPGWKGLGARAGYSTLNGLVITLLCLFGLVGLAAAIIPVEAGACIVLWIGIIITAQAFNAAHQDQHEPAVAVGLFPAIAAWGATVMMGAYGTAGGVTLQEMVTPPAPNVAQMQAATQSELSVSETDSQVATPTNATPDSAGVTMETAETAIQVLVDPKSSREVNGFLVHGLLLMERGYIFTCMLLAAACACLIDRKYNAAGMWMLVAALLTWLGLMHAYQVYAGFAFDYLFRFVEPAAGAYAYRADDIFVGYMLCAALFFSLSLWAGDEVGAEH